MAKFKVGDVCVVIGTKNYPELLGRELTIVDSIQPIYDENWNCTRMGYVSDLVHKGVVICPSEEYLRLKKFPGEDLIMSLFVEKERELV